MDKYVCAFRGRRDSYQVPVALAEAGLLDQFITDAYATRLVRAATRFAPGALRAKIDFRSEPGIPMERVRCLWGTTVIEHLRHRTGYAPMATFNKLDRNFSWAAARRAAQTRSHLFLYSPYAWEAFTARYPHTPHKVLFQYHPHPEMEQRILAADSTQHPSMGESFSGTPFGQVPGELLRRERDCWKHSDLIFCASTFTKRSLLEAGADEAKCRVVPYGIDLPAVAKDLSPTEAFQVVFVGSGGQRKGLHHLLLAWQKAALPASSKLTLVCRAIDREIERLAAATARVEIIRGLPQGQLNALYARSSLFVMPSLVEGFGQVYLEALAQGCPVLGTANTGLPDLGGEAEGVFLVSPGNVCELAGQLERLAGLLLNNSLLRKAARGCAAKFTWPAFRKSVRLAIGNLLS
jgi:hypothetical protein